ncbi:hypothetical protein, partial [Rhizobium hidalgonense]|uniref:hypothetical protein n=1 Tax=Rhizobium hidalgonense TaxID=1538159 RepID=UPI001056297A
ERKTSSPAAPPPSFSEWAYRTNPPKQSTAVFEKTDFSFMLLFFKINFQPRRKYGRFPDSDWPNPRQENERLSTFREKNALLPPCAPTSSQSAGLKRHMIHTGKCRQTAFPWAI